MKIVLIGGPPGAGKDTLAKHFMVAGIHNQDINPYQRHTMKFAESLKLATHALHGMISYDFNHANDITKTPYTRVYGPNWFVGRLHEPCDEFFGATPADTYKKLWYAVLGSEIAMPDFTADFNVFVHALFGLFTSSTDPLPDGNTSQFYVGVIRADYFEPTKNLLCHFFQGKSARQAYIYVSEDLVKPLFNDKQFFGKVFVNCLKQIQGPNPIIFISDSGFEDEATPVIIYTKPDNCILFRIHAEERNKTFKGDSRSYISLPLIFNVDIDNNIEGHTLGFLNTSWNILNKWLKGNL